MSADNDHLLWIRQAEQDLQQSLDSMAAGRYDWAAYAAQQSAEKNLKGILLALPPKCIYLPHPI
ncbi:MAG: HEPN domain-containing protein [Sedimenticola sp.]